MYNNKNVPGESRKQEPETEMFDKGSSSISSNPKSPGKSGSLKKLEMSPFASSEIRSYAPNMTANVLVLD